MSAYPIVCHVCGRSSAPVAYPPPGVPGPPVCADHTPAAQLAVAERVLGPARVARLRVNPACAEDVIEERREYIHAHWLAFGERERLARDLVAKVLAPAPEAP